MKGRPVLTNARTDQTGLSLVELLMVCIVLGVVAAIALPFLFEQRDQAYESVAQADVRNAAMQLQVYRAENDGELPLAWSRVIQDAGHVPSEGLRIEDGGFVHYEPDTGCVALAHRKTPDRPWHSTLDPTSVRSGWCPE